MHFSVSFSFCLSNEWSCTKRSAMQFTEEMEKSHLFCHWALNSLIELVSFHFDVPKIDDNRNCKHKIVYVDRIHCDCYINFDWLLSCFTSIEYFSWLNIAMSIHNRISFGNVVMHRWIHNPSRSKESINNNFSSKFFFSRIITKFRSIQFA